MQKELENHLKVPEMRKFIQSTIADWPDDSILTTGMLGVLAQFIGSMINKLGNAGEKICFDEFINMQIDTLRDMICQIDKAGKDFSTLIRKIQ